MSDNPQGDDVTDTDHPAFEAAERLAPTPYDKADATTEAWIRHYAALGLAAHCEFRRALPGIRRPVLESRPDLGYLITIATASTATAVALSTDPEKVARKLWALTPEAGALNGEWEEWLVDKLDALGVNPADIDPAYEAADFVSPSVTAVP